MKASSPTTANGPMLALGAIFANGAITALGCTPLAIVESSRNSAAALAKATFAFSARKTVFPATASPSGSTTHLAAEDSARAACFAESRKIRSADEARSGAATPVSSIDPSPSTTAPIAAAKLSAVCFITPPKNLPPKFRSIFIRSAFPLPCLTSRHPMECGSPAPALATSPPRRLRQRQPACRTPHAGPAPQRTDTNAASPLGRVFHRACIHTHCSGYLRMMASITFANCAVFSRMSRSPSPV